MTFNARAETVAEEPMFRSVFKTRRCVIPAAGFYDWTGAPGSKAPHYFVAASGEALAFAALWEQSTHPETGGLLTSDQDRRGARQRLDEPLPRPHAPVGAQPADLRDRGEGAD